MSHELWRGCIFGRISHSLPVIVNVVVSINEIMCGDSGCIEWRLLKIFGSFDPRQNGFAINSVFFGSQCQYTVYIWSGSCKDKW